jgi:hypothetical protein
LERTNYEVPHHTVSSNTLLSFLLSPKELLGTLFRNTITYFYVAFLKYGTLKIINNPDKKISMAMNNLV